MANIDRLERIKSNLYFYVFLAAYIYLHGWHLPAPPWVGAKWVVDGIVFLMLLYNLYTNISALWLKLTRKDDNPY